jgi:subtilase family serine protease
MAGMQALVNQQTHSRWGNPNPVYYQLAAMEYANGGTANCSSSANPSNNCIFRDVTLGDIDVNCTGTNHCFFGPAPGLLGVLSTSNTAYQPAYRAATGWDFATGIGTVNAWTLLKNWPVGAGASAASRVASAAGR